MAAADPPHPLLAPLERVVALSEAERAAILLMPVRFERVREDLPILREGARPTRCCIVLQGFACSSKIVSNGGRQITAFHIAGDMPDLMSLHLQLRDCDIWALTDCDLAFIEHRDMLRLCEEHPRLTGALWRATLVDGSVFREWVVNVGQREGIARVSHVFCEMMTRMKALGLARDGECALPITQDDLAEATGLSVVHVNRLLQEIRRQKLVSFSRGRLTVHDWDGLATLGDFRPDYLHLEVYRAA